MKNFLTVFFGVTFALLTANVVIPAFWELYVQQTTPSFLEQQNREIQRSIRDIDNAYKKTP